MILAPNEMKAETNEQKSCKVCLEVINLDPELYRIGHTKARSYLTKHFDEKKLAVTFNNQTSLPHSAPPWIWFWVNGISPYTHRFMYTLIK